MGLNRAEAMLRSGNYIETATLPSGLGFEAAGLVESVGEGGWFRTGRCRQRRAAAIDASLACSYGELVSFPAELVVKHPPSLSWEAAAAVWMQYVTAYGALIDLARLGKGDFVVITAASSSVGLAAIQVANMVGATPIAVTRTSAKAQALREVGAAHVVASGEDNLEARLKEIAGPKGVRVVFDPIGGPAFEPLTAAMSRGGILIEYGALSREPTPFPLFAVLSKEPDVAAATSSTRSPVIRRGLEAAKAFILDGLVSGAPRPVIAKTFPFDEIVAAHRFLESNEQFGKIVVTV